MSEAPERIWIDPEVGDSWWSDRAAENPEDHVSEVEYVRADIWTRETEMFAEATGRIHDQQRRIEALERERDEAAALVAMSQPLTRIKQLERERDEARGLAELFKPDDEPDLPWNVSAWPAATEEQE